MNIDNFRKVIQHGLRTVFRCAKKACEEDILRGDTVFDRKIEDFSIENSVAPIDFFKERLGSVARFDEFRTNLNTLEKEAWNFIKN